MNRNDIGFWNVLDELVDNSEIIIDRPKGTAHPKYSDFIYRVDYGYLKDTSSMDGNGIRNQNINWMYRRKVYCI